MARVQTISTTETIIEENTRAESQMVMGYTPGLMVVHMRGTLKVVLSMGKENGKKLLKSKEDQLMSTMGSMRVIKNVDMENLNGQVEIHTKGSTRMMKGMVMER